MEDAARLFPGVHPNALRHLSANPIYVSGGKAEYQIRREGAMWRVKRHPRGMLPPQLRTDFLSFKQCEDALIRFLKSKDKWGKAIYPGKENGKS